MNLTPEQINQFLADAVLKSQIGKAVEDAVARSIGSLTKTYDNPFDHVIKNHIHSIIEKEIVTKYAPLLQEKVEKAIANFMTEEYTQKVIEAGLEKLKARY